MLNRSLAIGALAALALGTAAPVYAQATLTGTQALQDRLDDAERAARDDLRRAEDASRFGNPEFRTGMSGSASLSYSGKRGSMDSQELTAGTRVRFAQGNFVQTLGAAIDYAETNSVRSKQEVFGVYDANYFISGDLYAFVLGRVAADKMAVTADQNRLDAFVGVGPGYRVINTPDLTWRVQAGVGYSYTENGLRQKTRETGYIASSRLFYKFSDSVFATNDTDILKSKSALRINNDLGVNFRLTDAFATRVSYLSEYNDSRATRTENKVGLSLVYSF